MNKYLWFLLLIIFVKQSSFAQNIFPNPGFEDYNLCPTYTSQIDRCVAWDSAYGTADYYNCGFYLPSTIGDYGIPKFGTGVVGFVCKPPSNFSQGYRFYGESFQAKLNEVLIPGAQYELSAHLLYNLVTQPPPAGDCFDLGFYFFKDGNFPSLVLGDCPKVYPQVKIAGSAISAGVYSKYTLNFTSDSCFDHVMIGFFCNDSTETPSCKVTSSTFYFDIDDVSLIKISDAPVRVSAFTASQQVICSGSCISFFDTTFQSSNSYEWIFPGGSPGTSNFNNPQQICYNTSGNFDAKMITHYECFSDTVKKMNYILVKENPTLNITADSTPQCFGVPVTLLSNSNILVTWSDGSISDKLIVKKEGIYSATASNSCATVYGEMEIKFIECPCSVFYPNAYSPNNDGKNDAFQLAIDCEIQDFQIRIWNRWGQEIFSSNDPYKSWNGTYEGKMCMDGVYCMTLQYKAYFGNRLKSISQRSTITLLR